MLGIIVVHYTKCHKFKFYLKWGTHTFKEPKPVMLQNRVHSDQHIDFVDNEVNRLLSLGVIK